MKRNVLLISFAFNLFLVSFLFLDKSWADSSKVKPHEGAASVYTSGGHIPAKPIDQGCYDLALRPGDNCPALPYCPGDPAHPNAYTNTPICPDINGKWPAAYQNASQAVKDQICPDQCTVTRNVVLQSLGGIMNVYEAVCPPGYVQVGMYNLDFDVVYNSTPQVMPYPMDKTAYDEYSNSGYSCGLSPQGGSTPGECTRQQTVYFSYPTYRPERLVIINGFVGQYTTRSETLYCLNSNCQITVQQGGCYLPSFQERRYSYNYAYYQCTKNKGLVYSTNHIPISRVCARSKPTWQKNN